MLIVGAGGFAKELFEIFQQKKDVDNIAFYDDVNIDAPDWLFGRFPVLKNESQAKVFLSNDNQFTIGIGNPSLRYKLYKKFLAIGGLFISVISPKANIGSFDVEIKEGCNILDGAILSNYTKVGTGCIIYYNAVITHNSRLGNFVQVSPSVNILGAGIINDFTFIGANVTILPKVEVGKYAVIGAGSVVTKAVSDYTLMVGNPARRAGWVSKYGEKLVFDKDNKAVCTLSHDQYILTNGCVEAISKDV